MGKDGFREKEKPMRRAVRQMHTDFLGEQQGSKLAGVQWMKEKVEYRSREAVRWEKD